MSRTRNRGAADASVSHWWHQRLTAVALIPVGVWLAVALPRVDLGSHAAIVAWIGRPVTAVLLGLMSICLVYHSWLGIRVVLEDYVQGPIRLALRLSTLVHAVLLASCLYAIVRIAVGGI
jgi:succinate dehydrogenase / fumarate reductase membrane anchor subunit